MSSSRSPLESQRIKFIPQLPNDLQDISSLSLEPVKDRVFTKDDVKKQFPHISEFPLLKKRQKEKGEMMSLKVGVVFSGGQAPGGHNIIAGLFDALEKMGGGELIGFLDGPSGITSCKYKVLSKKEVDLFRNTGGFDLLGSGRTKIETPQQFEEALNTCNSLKLDGLVVVGGDDSNTNAAFLAEYFQQNSSLTNVVGIPKTIDGDLKNEFVPLSFGFDTASRVYAELIGNLERDALSAKKYYHFIRLMGRTASHIALECALLTRPNLTLIAEEVFEKKITLQEIVKSLCNLVLERFAQGKSYGVIVIPEGLIEWMPDVSALIQELNAILSDDDKSTKDLIMSKLTEASKECFSLIPETIQNQLLLVRDPHGNVQVSLIETERLLAEMVSNELKKHKEVSFHALPHFFGYEGRAAFPSNFDATYCYSLGHVAMLLISKKLTGYMGFISNLHREVENWDFGAVPLTALMHMEMRKGKLKPVIQKALVELKGKAFESFVKQRDTWRLEDCYCFPGPIQFSEKPNIPLSLSLELE
jgi:diphosphate-dependent phosphofructokinase